MKARIILILLMSCWYFLGPAANSINEWVGTPAPDFTLKTLSGNATISLKDYKGSLVLLDLFPARNGKTIHQSIQT